MEEQKSMSNSIKGNNPVLNMDLSEENRRNIRSRLGKNICKPLSTLSSGETCRSTNECRCGEFCSFRRLCEPATCDISTSDTCQTYRGLNNK